MKKYFGLLFLLFSLQLVAENPCGHMNPRETKGQWGNGGVYLPIQASIKIYSKDLEEIGTIDRTEHRIILKNKGQNEKQKYATSNVEYIGHYNYLFLKAIDSHKDDYLEIFINNTDLNHPSYLVDREELFNSGGDFCTYSELLFDNNLPDELLKGKAMANLGINLSTICLNLRKSPSKNAAKISCFGNRGLEGIIKVDNVDSKGKWMKVKISFCAQKDIDESDMDEGGCGGCCCNKKETTFEGWMKALSEDGFPNIWYSVTAY